MYRIEHTDCFEMCSSRGRTFAWRAIRFCSIMFRERWQRRALKCALPSCACTTAFAEATAPRTPKRSSLKSASAQRALTSRTQRQCGTRRAGKSNGVCPDRNSARVSDAQESSRSWTLIAAELGSRKTARHTDISIGHILISSHHTTILQGEISGFNR